MLCGSRGPALFNKHANSFIRTLRLKVCPESYPWLNAAAVEVNQVYNYTNEMSYATATRTDRKRKWLSGFDLCSLTAGASEYFEHIGADTIQSRGPAASHVAPWALRGISYAALRSEAELASQSRCPTEPGVGTAESGEFEA